MGFLTQPHVRLVEGRYPWQLTRELIYDSDWLEQRIIVPAGYCTDFASVPRIPGVYALTGDRAIMASICHDWLYDARPKGVTRRDADLVFLEAMESARDPHMAWIRRLMYWGVRVGGGRAWRRDSRHKVEHLI